MKRYLSHQNMLADFSKSTPPAIRAITRQQAYEQLLRLCEAVLSSMARRRMH